MTAVDVSKSATNYRPVGLACAESAVCVRGVSYWYGSGENRSQALVDVDLEVDPGEVVILTGPSGSGKTTLLTLIGALRRVEKGSLRVLGRDVAKLGPAGQVALRRDIGFIFQKHNLFSSLSAFENVRMATALKPAPVEEMNRRAVGILTRLGMGDRIGHLPSQLSGGQSQRVAIARALVNDPKLVLADEPTASLDARSGQEVLDLLKELASGPLRSTIIIVTHDQRVLDRADRIVNLVSGRIVSNVRPEVSVRIVKVLQTIPTLHGLSPSTLARVADHMTVQSFRPGEVIVRQGTEGERIYVVGDGVAEAIKDDGPPREIAPGETFGTVTAQSQRRVPETVRARTPLEVFVMTAESFQQVLETDKDLEQRVRHYYMTRQ